MIRRNFKRLIIYELNEVPIRVLNHFIKNNPDSNISSICNKDTLKKTFTTDEGELHPWSTWPTVHRGVDNRAHKIRFINQDLKDSKSWPPIWEILIKNRFSIGIFGSLQSYPPITNSFVSFYLPDTFAPTSKAIPKELESFQNFNLKLTNKNKAISRAISLNDIFKFLKLVVKGNFKIISIYKVFLQVFLEIINKKYKTLRSLIQPILGFDIYLKLLEKEKPDFSTFFTNHVAGIMHRYWKYTFNEDFEDNKNNQNSFHKKSINKAMNIADKQIGQLIKFCSTNNYELWIISSMGQEAIKRKEEFPEIYVGDINKIIKALGLNPNQYKLLPAMQPDLCINCKNKNSFEKLLKNISRIRDVAGNKIFVARYRNSGNSINISIKHSLNASQTKKFEIEGKIFTAKQLNIQFVKRDIGTGYHCKEGIFIGYGKRSINLFAKYGSNEIDTKDFFRRIKDYFYIK